MFRGYIRLVHFLAITIFLLSACVPEQITTILWAETVGDASLVCLHDGTLQFSWGYKIFQEQSPLDVGYNFFADGGEYKYTSGGDLSAQGSVIYGFVIVFPAPYVPVELTIELTFIDITEGTEFKYRPLTYSVTKSYSPSDCEKEPSSSKEIDPYNPPQYALPVVDELPANPDGTPFILNSFCAGQQLIIILQFEKNVTGQYEVTVDDVPYTYDETAPVTPNRLAYVGPAPPGGGAPIIQLVDAERQTIVTEITDYDVPQCDFQPQNNGGGNESPSDSGGYVPPSQ